MRVTGRRATMWDRFTAISRAFSPVVGEVGAEDQLDPEGKEARWIRIA
jgi:hypothetical protein